MAYIDDPHPVYCTTCDREADPGARFCDNCGASLDPQYTPGLTYFDQDSQDVEYMGFWIRLPALLIDVILLVIVGLVIRFALGESTLTSVVSLAFNLGYAVILTAWRGQTVGKMALGIQVVDRDGNIPGIGAVLLREIVGKFLSGIALGLGYLWVAWDREKRGWHDHIAGTYVVRKSRSNQVR